MPGVGGWVRSQISNFVGENVPKGGKHVNIYSAEDCRTSIVVIIFIYHFWYLE